MKKVEKKKPYCCASSEFCSFMGGMLLLIAFVGVAFTIFQVYMTKSDVTQLSERFETHRQIGEEFARAHESQISSLQDRVYDIETRLPAHYSGTISAAPMLTPLTTTDSDQCLTSSKNGAFMWTKCK